MQMSKMAKQKINLATVKVLQKDPQEKIPSLWIRLDHKQHEGQNEKCTEKFIIYITIY